MGRNHVNQVKKAKNEMGPGFISIPPISSKQTKHMMAMEWCISLFWQWLQPLFVFLKFAFVKAHSPMAALQQTISTMLSSV
jgi:hypothetical protein